MGLIQRAVDRAVDTKRYQNAQQFIDSRALEIASSTRALHDQHAEECKDRYVESDRKLEAIREAQRADFDKLERALKDNALERQEASRRTYALLWKTAFATIGMLVVICGYLLTHGGFLGH